MVVVAATTTTTIAAVPSTCVYSIPMYNRVSSSFSFRHLFHPQLQDALLETNKTDDAKNHEIATLKKEKEELEEVIRVGEEAQKELQVSLKKYLEEGVCNGEREGKSKQ